MANWINYAIKFYVVAPILQYPFFEPVLASGPAVGHIGSFQQKTVFFQTLSFYQRASEVSRGLDRDFPFPGIRVQHHIVSRFHDGNQLVQSINRYSAVALPAKPSVIITGKNFLSDNLPRTASFFGPRLKLTYLYVFYLVIVNPIFGAVSFDFFYVIKAGRTIH